MEEKNENFFNGFDDDILTDNDFEDNNAGNGANDNGTDNSNGEGKPEEGKTAGGNGEGSVKAGNTVSDAEADEAKKKAEAAEKNAKFAEMRRKQEAEAKAKKEREAEIERAKKEAAAKAEIGVLKTNPYTEQPIIDESDLKIYKIQKALEDEGKDPVKDLAKKLGELEREEKANKKKAEEEAEKAKKDAEEKALREVEELRNAYPKVNTAELKDDPLWKQACEGRIERLTVKEIYEYCYLPLKEASNNQSNDNGKKITKVLSSNSNGGKTSSINYLEMSDEEYLKHEKSENNDFFD